MSIQAILTDIEGTTTDIRFVHDVLFPYARKAMASFLVANQARLDVREQIDAVRLEVNEPDASLDRVTEILIHWIDTDQKITPLKALQGMIWADGYEQKAFTGHVYPDAHRFLTLWKEQGVSLNVFSSGSVKAQKLIFGFSDFGDMTPLFDRYFDTRTGAKREQAAYDAISAEMNTAPEHILFLSDIEAELDAAKGAGFNTLLLCRDDKPQQPKHAWVTDFSQIHIEQ
jgi:enolase-phosphatase E1